MNFKKTVEEQMCDKSKETVAKVIKQKEGLIRDTDTLDKKKTIMLFGLKENVIQIRHEKERRKRVLKIVKKVQGEERDVTGEVEEITKLGKYTEG